MKARDLSIGEVADQAAVSASAIRYYESEGLIPPARRTNGRRTYDDSVFTYLATIRLAQDSGFTVAEMKQLMENCAAPSKATAPWRDLAKAKIRELDETVAKATAMKNLLGRWVDCNCVDLEDCRLIADRLRS